MATTACCAVRAPAAAGPAPRASPQRAALSPAPCPRPFLAGAPLALTSHAPRRGRSHGGSREVVRMGLFGLGAPEILVIAGVSALLFGPSKLPELGKGLGKTVRSFQTAAKEFETELKTELKDGEEGESKSKEVAIPEKKEGSTDTKQ